MTINDIIEVGAKYFTHNEVAKHSTEQDAWIIFKGRVLDITALLKYMQICAFVYTLYRKASLKYM